VSGADLLGDLGQRRPLLSRLRSSSTESADSCSDFASRAKNGVISAVNWLKALGKPETVNPLSIRRRASPALLIAKAGEAEMRGSLKTLSGVVALSAALLAASAASATAVVVTQTFDLTTPGTTETSSSVISFNNQGFMPALSNASPVPLTNGDSLDLKISFLAGQAVQFTSVLGNFQIGLVVSDSASPTLNPGSSLTLFDTGGNAIKTFSANIGFNQSTGNVVGDDFFTVGVPLSGNVGSLEYINPGISGLTGTKNFTADTIALSASAGSFKVLTGQVVTPPTGGVPEPATWAMMLVGFGGLGAMMRRRRALTAA